MAPLGKTDAVRELCAVEADLSHIPESQITKVRGSDGFMYFSIDGQIEIVCECSHTTFGFMVLQRSPPNSENRQITDYHIYLNLQRYVRHM